MEQPDGEDGTSMLPPDVQVRMDELCAQGDAGLDSGNFDEALDAYLSALRLIPEPQEDWQAATWITMAIGETFYFMGDFVNAMKMMELAVVCPDGLGNPAIHLRLGQISFELGDRRRAADELTRAYMGGGEEIFDDEDSRYWEFLRTVIVIDEPRE